MRTEKVILLLGDSIIDNGEYVRSGEPDIARQLERLLPHHRVVKRAVDGAKSADVLASQIAEVETAGHVILSAGGNGVLEHIDLLDAAEERAKDVLQQEGRRRSFDILELRTLFDDRADYANPIEPSAIGGTKLAKSMSEWVEWA